MNESTNNSDSGHASDSPPLEYARPIAVRRRSTRAIIGWTILGLFAALLAISVLLPALNSPHPAPPRVRSASNMKQIGLAMQMYANDHNHEFPDSMSTILANEDLTPEVFVYPTGNDTPATGPTTQAVLTNLAMPGHCSDLYFAKGMVDTGDAATVTACEKQQPNAPGMNVLSSTCTLNTSLIRRLNRFSPRFGRDRSRGR